jgi:hypothetical protein
MSLYGAMLGVVAWLVVSIGGFGGLLYLGVVAETVFERDSTWIGILLWLVYAIGCLSWWGGIAAILLGGRAFFGWVSELSGRLPFTSSEWIVLLGHAFVLMAAANALLFPRVVETEYVYGFLLVAATFYGSGLCIAALTRRSSGRAGT